MLNFFNKLFKFVAFCTMIAFIVFAYNQREVNRELFYLQLKTISTISELHPPKNSVDKEIVHSMLEHTKSKYGFDNSNVKNNYDFGIKIPEFKAPEKPKKLNNISSNTNLAANTDLTPEDMNKIINHWDKYVRGGTSFKNKGAVFIQASKETGLDPVYILAHAAWESSWGNSSLAKNKHNYFGIAAYDHDPYNSAYVMGDTIDNGIIKGAKWIKANYYNKGCKTLQAMISIGNYASDSGWSNGILSIMKESYRII